QPGREAPLVRPAPPLPQVFRPLLPPGRRPPGERLDDEDAAAAPGRVHQLSAEPLARAVLELVDGVGGHDAAAPVGERGAGDVVRARAAPEAEPAEGPAGLPDRPSAAVDAFHARLAPGLE